VNKMLATIRAEKSKSFKPDDRDRIFEVIRDEIGFSKLNAMIFECYREWVIETSLSALQDCTEDSVEHADMLLVVGALLMGQGNYEMAELYGQSSLNKRKDARVENHPKTLNSMNNLAILYQRQGRYEEAEPLYLECWTKRKDALGENHPDTLNSLHCLAILYTTQGRYQEAESLYLECWSKRKDALGENHPDTLNSMNSLTILYESQGRHP
jgi:tetratricopeptide (TPR) repeat protein